MTIKQAILSRKEEEEKSAIKYQNVNCKIYNKTSIQAKNCAQTYTLVVNKLKRTPFQEVHRTAHTKLFSLSSYSALKPSSIFTTASTSKMDFSYPQIITFTL